MVRIRVRARLRVRMRVRVRVRVYVKARATCSRYVLNVGSLLRRETLPGHNVCFVGNHHDLLVGEERANGLEELQLIVEGVSTLLRDIQEIQHTALEMGQRGDGLHLDCVSLFQRTVKNPFES
jgi:hypothetical protein